MRCRKCKAPKWRGSACLNADCETNTRTVVQLRGVKTPHTLAVKHGYHAAYSVYADRVGYDAPIRASRWVSAS